jgi:hypothetical protein
VVWVWGRGESFERLPKALMKQNNFKSLFHGFFSRCGLGNRGVGVLFPVGAGYFSLCYNVQAGSEAHQASYIICNGECFFVVKAAGA